MLKTPFYDPNKSYEENFEQGPFGAFADGEVFENTTKTTYTFLGFKVNSPFGIPAGPLVNGKFCKAALDKGFDIVTYKTVRSREYPSHPWPNVLSVKVEGDLTPDKTKSPIISDNNYQEPLSITNSFGVPSKEVDFWKKDLTELVKSTREGQIVVGSFQGTKVAGQTAQDYINDYRITSGLLKETGVKVMEVNLSCPNEGTNNLLCYDIDRSVEVAKVIKEVIGEIPLIIKVAYYEDDNALRELVQRIGSVVEGISTINTIPAKIVDGEGKQALPGEGRAISGVCGHSIKWAGVAMVKKLKKLREEFGYTYQIIGVGGVCNADDFLEYRNAGADAVMSATGAMWNPYLAKEIKEKLS